MNVINDEFRSMFPSYCEFEETGVDPAIVVRYRSFCLKIYQRPDSQSYEVQRLQYNNATESERINLVPYNKMREFIKSNYSANADRISCIRHGR